MLAIVILPSIGGDVVEPQIIEVIVGSVTAKHEEVVVGYSHGVIHTRHRVFLHCDASIGFEFVSWASLSVKLSTDVTISISKDCSR